MKKDVYLIVGIVALIATAFVFGYARYSKPAVPGMEASSNVDSESETSRESGPARADAAKLLGKNQPSKGPLMAKVVVVEFLDPECEACRAFNPRVKKVLAEFEGKIRFVIRYMPYHHNSANAIKALYAATEQNKVWEYLELLFEKQSEWGEKSDDQSAKLAQYAQSLGMDMKKFKADVASDAAAELVKSNEADGKSVGVAGTPSFYINGLLLSQLGEEPLRQAISAAVNEK